mgnify:CR=1 FL=1
MSFPRYSEYKGSGVRWLGDVPAHWSISPVKAVATCNDDVLDESTHESYEIEYVEISSIEAGKGITQTESMSFGNAPSRARRRVIDGDIIVSTVRTYLRAIAPIVSPPDNLAVSTGFAVIRPHRIVSGYLGYLFQAEFVISEVISRSVGVSYPAINASELMCLHIPVPELHEQASIATFLDRETAKIDSLIAEQVQLIALLKEKRQAVISHAVTKGLNPDAPMKDSGVEWLGMVPAHWSMGRVKHYVRSLGQGWSPQCESFPIETNDEWGVLKVGCVNGGRFNPAENKKLPSTFEIPDGIGIKMDDLLISRANTRELVGSAAVVENDYPRLLLCDKLYRVRLDKSNASSLFLAYYLASSAARGQIELAATGASSSMVNIGQSTILEMPIALPSLAEQIGIAESIRHELDRLKSLSDEADAAIMLLKERRSALISAAVTGKIDVRKAV